MGIPIVFFSRNNLPRKKESGEERLVYICYERGEPIDLVLAELNIAASVFYNFGNNCQ